MNQHNRIKMKYFILVAAALAAVAVADHGPVHAPVHHAPVHHAPVHHAPVHHAPAPHHGGGYHEPHYEPAPAHYSYEYGVSDEYGLNFGAGESRDGYATKGQYHVQLPDGRLQTVTYHVDDAYSGYVADVQYSGKSHYEPHHPAPVHHAPVHHAPVHHAPVHHAPAYHAPIHHAPAYHA